MNEKLPLITLLFLLFVTACSQKSPEVKTTKTVTDVIPLTVSNMRGHKALYDEGWFIISSTNKALQFAKEKSISSSAQAISQMKASLTLDINDYLQELKRDINDSIDVSKNIYQKGQKQTQKIFASTQEIAKDQIIYGSVKFLQAWDTLIKGNLSLVKRTKSDRLALKQIPGQYFQNLKKDFSNIYSISDLANENYGSRIVKVWDEAFSQSKEAFIREYETSGEAENSLFGLVDILKGYVKFLYYAVAKPVTETAVDTLYTTGKTGVKVLFLPVAATVSVTGRTVQSLGLTLYHTTALGIKLVSPTVEAGLLTGLSLLSLGTVPITYLTGTTAGVVNQVGYTAAAPIAGATYGVVNNTWDRTKLVLFVGYDVIKGSTKVLFNQAASGVVLGYNALTAIPTHLVMGAADAAFFLAWDGPRLVVAMAKGEVQGFSAGKLPVGTVVDLSLLQKEPNMDVEVISTDEHVIQNLLQKLPKDMKVGLQ